MGRTLITPGARWRPNALMAAVLAAIITTGVTAETSIALNQGANIAVTAPAAFNRMAFDLAGQIWLAGGMHEPATPLTESGALNQRPVFSRDGHLVAYESLLSVNRQIFITDVRSGKTRQITFGPFDHLAPSWSPSGDRLVMSSNRGGTFDIWEVDIDTLELRQLTFTTYNERDPVWNDDGTRLAYVATSAQGSSLYILSPGDKPRRVLHEREQIVAPAWRPGGGLLTYTRLGQRTNQLRMLILSTPPVTKPITHNEQVSPRSAHWLDRLDFLYAADGKIRRRELGLPMYEDVPFSVQIDIKRDARSSRDTFQLNHGNRSVRGADGSTKRADGRYVVSTLGDLWEFQPDSAGKLRLTRQLTNDAFIDAQPAFSPDGQRLAFVSDRSGRPQIWIMELESLRLRRLTHDVAVMGTVTWNPEGTAVAYLVADGDSPQNGYWLRLADIESKRWRTLALQSRNRGKPFFANGKWAIDAEQTMRHEALMNINRPGLPLSWRPADAGGRYIVRAGRIFDGIGPEYVTRQDIVIDRDRIVAIRPWSDAEPDTPMIDATEHTVIPGLIDLATRQEPVDDERNGRKWLAAGVTTIRQTIDFSNPDDFDRASERLESWGSGRRSGPRMMMTVRPCDVNTGRFDKSLFERIAANVKTLNIVAIELCPGLAGEELTGTIRRAHKHGLAVIATTPAPGMTPGADELRPDALLAGKLQPDLTVWSDFLLISGAAGVTIPSRLVTAFWADNRILDGLNSSWQYRKIFTADEQRRFNASWRSNHPPKNIAPIADPNRILGADGSIIIGSEAPLTPQGLGLHGELRRLAASGLQPFQILKMAGLDAARSLGYGELLGLVRVGRQADLVILDGDPLTNIDAAVAVVGTIVNGRFYSRKDLTTPGLRRQSHLSVGNFYNSVRP